LRKDLDAFFKATERWHLTSAERRALLGVSSEERWLRYLHDAAPQLSPQEMVRVRAVIQIDEALAMCVSDSREVALWFRTRKAVAPFSGCRHQHSLSFISAIVSRRGHGNVNHLIPAAYYRISHLCSVLGPADGDMHY
jgi:hypothetical protein